MFSKIALPYISKYIIGGAVGGVTTYIIKDNKDIILSLKRESLNKLNNVLINKDLYKGKEAKELEVIKEVEKPEPGIAEGTGWKEFLFLGGKETKESRILDAFEAYNKGECSSYNKFWLWYNKHYYKMELSNKVPSNRVEKKSGVSQVIEASPQVKADIITTPNSELKNSFIERLQGKITNMMEESYYQFLNWLYDLLLQDIVLMPLVFIGIFIAVLIFIKTLKRVIYVVGEVRDLITSIRNLFKK